MQKMIKTILNFDEKCQVWQHCAFPMGNDQMCNNSPCNEFDGLFYCKKHFAEIQRNGGKQMNEETKEQEQKGGYEPSEENVELDMDKYGTQEITSGGGRPIFEKITKAKIMNATLMTTKERKEVKDKSGNDQVFYPVYLKVLFNVDGHEVYENMGGGKLFVSEDVDKKDIFWLGADSALGKIKDLIEDNFGFEGTLKDIPKILIGLDVGIKTVEQTVAGKVYVKNLIHTFYK